MDLWENTCYILVGNLFYLLLTYPVALSKLFKNKAYIGTLVAFATLGNRCHIRTICFQHDTVEGNGSGQDLRQVRFLKREYATNAQHEAVELQEIRPHAHYR